MFVANWVHRDVISGNILFLGKGTDVQGKLSDLEYAKPFLSDLHHYADFNTVRIPLPRSHIVSNFS